ncbi:hypothetical protein GIB67_035593 [Kingdonia uniflora]|uniref:Uncharacterized protein n=1 Tax=Kingdonia uniflora TaxID=39325 RepID=A0A7J7LD16_9MAGN|nr:hypothetical protein GIB67_035593 [Kingdonia uniflora]
MLPTNPQPTSVHHQYPCIRADLDQNTVFSMHSLTISAFFFAEFVYKYVYDFQIVGIGVPVFYKSQIDNAVSKYLFVSNKEFKDDD